MLILGACAPNPAATTIGAAPEPAGFAVDFSAKRVLRAEARGLAHFGPEGRRAAAPDDPMRVASISKLAVSLAAMRLVERGLLDLDADVSGLLGWRLRNPAFPDVPITLRQLMSHQSSLTDAGGYVIALDGDLQAFLARGENWDRAHPPGAYFRYANVNWPVVAALMERATGKRFDRIMQDELFAPLGLDACFNWLLCSPGAKDRAVTLYRPDGSVARDGFVGDPDQCPLVPAEDGGCDPAAYVVGRSGSAFSPQGGMRISALGLARLGQLLLQSGDGLLKPATFAEMIRPQWRFNGLGGDAANGEDDAGYFTAFGLGIQLLDREGRRWIGHPGEAYGLRAGLWVDRAGGEGRVRIATGTAEDYPIGHCLEDCP